jgi:ABC-type antimicrobial peptide transport system permease subunit
VQGIERVVRGVVADVRHSSLEEDSGLEMYIPLRQTNWTNYTQLIIRSNLPLEALTPAVRQRLAQEDPLLPTTTFRSLEAEIERSLSPRKFTLWLIGAFSIAALLLASLGIYGVVSYSVNQRTQEIGIRMTLGASAASVRSQVIGRTVKLASVGIAVGVAAALLLGRTMSSLLYGVSATDPWTFAAMTGLLLIVAALAGSIPARRISRTDLASVLRSA